jgi:hypothetical protein
MRQDPSIVTVAGKRPALLDTRGLRFDSLIFIRDGDRQCVRTLHAKSRKYVFCDIPLLPTNALG